MLVVVVVAGRGVGRGVSEWGEEIKVGSAGSVSYLGEKRTQLVT